MIIGVDEVGRGPIAGDLVVCAAAFTDKYAMQRLIDAGCQLMDSKAFKSKIQRERAFEIILSEQKLVWSIARKTPEEIDNEGIHHAVLNAMHDAAREVAKNYEKAEFRFDGRFVPPGMEAMNAEAVIKGDSLIPEISIASIIAKVMRDREMCDLALKHPAYGFERNSGYGTAQHIAAIKQNGLIDAHRSWAKKFLQDV